MDSQHTLESTVKSKSPSLAGSTLADASSYTEMKSENNSASDTQGFNEKVESSEPREVTWDGDNDPENPRNWPKWKKW